MTHWATNEMEIFWQLTSIRILHKWIWVSGGILVLWRKFTKPLGGYILKFVVKVRCGNMLPNHSIVGINPSPLTRSWRRSVRVFKPGGVCARQGVVCVRRARGLCARALCVCPVRVCALRVRASCTDGCARTSPWRVCDHG